MQLLGIYHSMSLKLGRMHEDKLKVLELFQESYLKLSKKRQKDLGHISRERIYPRHKLWHLSVSYDKQLPQIRHYYLTRVLFLWLRKRLNLMLDCLVSKLI